VVPECEEVGLAIFFQDFFQVLYLGLVHHKPFFALKRALIKDKGGIFKEFGEFVEKSLTEEVCGIKLRVEQVV
jgi:hypothetical protein